MRSLRKCIVSSVASCFFLSAMPVSAQIVIGEVSSLTGSKATFGTSTHKGLELAVNEINARGGINGKKIVLKTVDNQGMPAEAAVAMTRLINESKVAAVIGEFSSSLSLAMAPIAQTAKVPMLSSGSTNEKVTQVGDYIFRACFIDPFQGAVMAEFATKNLNAKTAAIFKDQKSDYSTGLAESFRREFIKRGGKIVMEQSYGEGDMDFKSQLTSIRGKKPNVLFVPGLYTEVGLIARQVKELGLKTAMLGGDGWDSEKLAQIAGPAINGAYFSNHYSAENGSAVVQTFIKKFRDTYKSTPDGVAALAYDSMGLMAKAIAGAKDLTGPAIREELAKIKDFDGVTGKITMGADRNPIKSAVILQYANLTQKFKTTINP